LIGKQLYGGREKKDQPPFNQQGGEDLSFPQKFTDKKKSRGLGKSSKRCYVYNQ
jgi:hypothetical protein